MTTTAHRVRGWKPPDRETAGHACPVPAHPPRRLLRAAVTLVLAGAGLTGCEAAPAGNTIALVGGDVIDGTGAPPLRGATVLIRDSVIEAVGADVAIPDDAEQIDVAGHSILPGLIDMHGHMYAMRANQFDAYSALFLAGGVTTVFSPGDFDPEGMIAQREFIARGTSIGPRILTAGPYFDHQPSVVPWIEGVASTEEALSKFRAWSDRIDAVKIYTSMTEAGMEVVIGAAHAIGLRVTGHLGGPVTTSRAIELGIDGLEHGIFAIAELTDVSQTAPLSEQYCAQAAIDLDSPVARDLIDAIVAENVWITPTIVTIQSIHPAFTPPTPDWADYLTEAARAALEEAPDYIDAEGADCLARALEIQHEFVRRVHEAGGLVVTGTDPVLPSITPGFGLHAEMANFVRAGLTPVDAIRAATSNGATALGIDERVGTIEAGKLADLVVVRGDPSERVEDVGNTVWVFKAGTRYDPRALLASVKGTIGLPEAAPPDSAGR